MDHAAYRTWLCSAVPPQPPPLWRCGYDALPQCSRKATLRLLKCRVSTMQSSATGNAGVVSLVCPFNLTRPEQLYARQYCEENVYQLCQRLLQEREAHKQRRAPEEDVDIDVYAVFISNEEERVLMYEQQSGDQHRGRIVWDYHVICITRTRSPSPASASPTSTSPSTSSLPPFLSPHPSRSCSLVYDLDSRLPFPCPFSLYVQRALLPAFSHSPSLHPLFRVAPAPLLLSTFASDRSHMLNDKGEWLAPPPAWPPLGHGHNLSEWKCITLDQVWPPSDPAGEHFGAVLDLTQLVTAFGPVDVDV